MATQGHHKLFSDREMLYRVFLVIPGVWLTAFFFIPLLLLFLRLVVGSEEGFLDLVRRATSPLYVGIYLQTIKVALVVTVLCLMAAYPVAYWLDSAARSAANVVLILVLFPLWINIVVRTYAFLVSAGRAGILNSFLLSANIIDEPFRIMYTSRAVYLGMTQVLLPYMILILYGTIRGIDKNLLWAGRTLGAGGFQVFVKILLPLSLPGVWGGCLLVFVISLGFFITPALLGGRADTMIAQVIERQVTTLGNLDLAVVIGMLLLISVLILVAIYNRYFSLDKIWGGLEKGR